MRQKLTLFAMLFVFGNLCAQEVQTDDERYTRTNVPRHQLRWLIDCPTAGMLPRGTFDLDMRTFPTGGLQSSLDIGLMNRFSVGLAYGGSSILSDSTPEWNPRMEFHLRYRLVEESKDFPAIAVGFCSQGYGPYDETNQRYFVKSKGFYLSMSKNFNFYTNPLGFHWGINYSFENEQDNDPSAFFGFNTELGNDMSFLAEYDFAFNDNKRHDIYGKGRGFINLGIAWYITDELSLELDLRNLLKNQSNLAAIDREVRLVYVEYFY